MTEKPAYTKPLPDMRPEGERFWAAAKEHKLLLPVDEHGTPFWYPRALTPRTLQPVDWIEAAGTGTLYSYSVHYFGPTKAYKGEPPYTVALVDLDEGVRLMTNIVEDEAPDYPAIDPEQVEIGMKLRVVFHDVTDEISLPKFTPAE